MDLLGIGEGLAKIAINVADRFIPDPKAKMEFELEMRKLDLSELIEQIKVNAVEAANPNVFVSGWRPFIGWVCGAAFAYKFIGLPVFASVALIWIPDFPMHKLPELDWTELLAVLGGMLGLGGMRSWEKSKGVASR